MEIRRYRDGDDATLYEICLRTGDSGRDATGRYADPDLLGHVYVGPYLALQPQFAFVLDAGDGRPVGYVLGALDSAAFEAACERSWWPPLRRRYPDPSGVPPQRRTPDERIAHLIHHPHRAAAWVAARYPSHLHIDVLPRAQRRGHGRRLIAHLLAAFTAAGSRGVHLGVSAANPDAVAFYRRIGLAEVDGDDRGFLMATSLPPPPGLAAGG
jgi:ribosomal protein S18 acetylase RimI-like enzyme